MTILELCIIAARAREIWLGSYRPSGEENGWRGGLTMTVQEAAVAAGCPQSGELLLVMHLAKDEGLSPQRFVDFYMRTVTD